MQDYRKLKVFHFADDLVKLIYKVTKDFPKEEAYGSTSQLRRASLSIVSNIVEGGGRKSNKEFKHFLNIASGSASEVEYQVGLAHDLGYMSSEELKLLTEKVVITRKMIISLIKKL